MVGNCAWVTCLVDESFGDESYGNDEEQGEAKS